MGIERGGHQQEPEGTSKPATTPEQGPSETVRPREEPFDHNIMPSAAGVPSLADERGSYQPEQLGRLSLNDYLREREAFLQARIYADLLRSGMAADLAQSLVANAFARARAAWDDEEPSTTRIARARIMLPFPKPTIQGLLHARNIEDR